MTLHLFWSTTRLANANGTSMKLPFILMSKLAFLSWDFCCFEKLVYCIWMQWLFVPDQLYWKWQELSEWKEMTATYIYNLNIFLG
jgi:hypothetical protein